RSDPAPRQPPHMPFPPPASSRPISHGPLVLHTPTSRFHRRRRANRRTLSSTARARRVCRQIFADSIRPLLKNTHPFLLEPSSCTRCAYRPSYRLSTHY